MKETALWLLGLGALITGVVVLGQTGISVGQKRVGKVKSLQDELRRIESDIAAGLHQSARYRAESLRGSVKDLVF